MFPNKPKKMLSLITAITVFSILFPTCFQGQQPSSTVGKSHDAAFYNLVFRVIEIEGSKVVSSDSYKTSVTTDRSVGTGASISAQDAFPVGANHYNTRKLGFTVFIKAIKTQGDNLCLDLQGRMSSLPVDMATGTPSVLVRSNDWDAQVLIPINKPTIVYSSDDPASKLVLEVELTVSAMGSER